MSFKEKENLKKDGLINAGIYFIDRTLILDTIPSEGVVSLEKDIFPKWIKKKILRIHGPGKIY